MADSQAAAAAALTRKMKKAHAIEAHKERKTYHFYKTFQQEGWPATPRADIASKKPWERSMRLWRCAMRVVDLVRQRGFLPDQEQSSSSP